jgi:hypothetical protein
MPAHACTAAAAATHFTTITSSSCIAHAYARAPTNIDLSVPQDQSLQTWELSECVIVHPSDDVARKVERFDRM